MRMPQKQQVVTVFKHGPKPRRMCRVLVAPHMPLQQIKNEISDSLGISMRESVLLNTMGGAEVNSVYDILTERNNIIIASYPGEFDLNVYKRRSEQPRGAYQRVVSNKSAEKLPKSRLPPMSKSSATRLPPIGSWDTSSDGRSSGSDIMQRRVGYERQMKRDYNTRHTSRIKKLKDDPTLEVSDILLSHDRQRRADHQIRIERRQKLAKQLQEQNHRMYLPDKRGIRRDPVPQRRGADPQRRGADPQRRGAPNHQEVVNLFTAPPRKLPNSLNKLTVLPTIDKPKHDRRGHPETKRKRDEVKVKPREPKPPDHQPLKKNPPIPYKPPQKATPQVSTQANSIHEGRPLTPIITTDSRRRSQPETPKHVKRSSLQEETAAQKDSVIKEEDCSLPQSPDKKPEKEDEEVKRYSGGLAESKKDSGIAESIVDQDSLEARRDSLTPEDKSNQKLQEEILSSPVVLAAAAAEESMVSALPPVTEETETESPTALESLNFKPILDIFHPLSESQLNKAYVLGSTLGDGNFAVVKSAINKATKESVAVKIIDKSKLTGKEGMMLNEIKIMRKLNHDNCVKLLAIHESEESIFLITELVRDGDLFDCIVKNRCFPEGVVRRMLGDMVGALHYMHSRSIVHRDIKPENILVNRIGGRYSLKLADFGLSMVVREPIYTICGTPTYIAPEILVECGYGLEIDMWAVGVINYILLCGFPPFRSKNKNQEELFTLIMTGEFKFISPYWDKISWEAMDLISKLLQVIPDERISAEEVLQHTWLKQQQQEEEE